MLFGHAHWNVGNFNKKQEYRQIVSVRYSVGVTCRFPQLFLRLQCGQVSSTCFVSVGDVENDGFAIIIYRIH
ncbi:hypothetical protein [Prevotella sp.]|uniref:hypothetical protein n=1 Tax=Segatella hominis TaxID=2518605 RepID=UPI00258E2247|nr:hypothetical protein [Prevotella sp.]